MDPKFVSKIKQNIRGINLLLFAIIAGSLIISVLSVIRWLFYSSSSFLIILLALAPAFGFVYLFVLSKGKTVKQHALYLGATHVIGFVILLILGAGSGIGILALLAYVVGAAANVLVYLEK